MEERTNALLMGVRERERALSNADAARSRAEKVGAQMSDAIESMMDGVILFDARDRFQFCNERQKIMFPTLTSYYKPGASLESILRAMLDAGLVPDEIEDGESWIGESLALHRGQGGSEENQLPDGRWILTRRFPTQEKGMLVIQADISEHHENLENIRKLSRAVEQSSSMVFITDTDGNIEYVNASFTEMTGYSEGEALGQNPRLIKSHETPPHVLAELWKTILAGREWRSEILDRRKNGTTFWAYASISPVKAADGAITHFVAMHEDISARKLTEENLWAAREQAVIASRAKSELLANMSHELRTPLNAIIGFSGVLGDEIFGELANEKQREYVRDIEQSGQHLLELINDILDVSAIEAGKLSLNEEELDPLNTVEAAIRLISPRALMGGIELTRNLESGLPRLWADERRLKQILLNLLANAVKFTNEGGRVTLGVSLSGDGGLQFSVTDTGIGMDEEGLVLALAPSGQVDSSLAREYEGSGLGLPLSKALIELHDGRPELESQLGLGTTARVLLPANRSRY